MAKVDVVYTATDHGFETGEEVYYGREVYYARVLDARSLILYTDTALTTVVTSAPDASTIISRDNYPDINIYPRSRFTNDGRGILGAFIFETSITTSVANYNLRTAALAGGWDGNSIIYATVTVAAGVYIWTDSTALAAFSTGTSWPDNSKIDIINNGYIIGKGGTGGRYDIGLPGGPAMSINYPVTITNNSSVSGGYIAGGGGGGGGNNFYYHNGGGGAGGGDGYNNLPGPNNSRNPGGAIGQPGDNGESYRDSYGDTSYGAGGGGRILPGTRAPANGGAGGQAGGAGSSYSYRNTGNGYGGGGNEVGGPGGNSGSGGGGWGAAGGSTSNSAGGVGGKAIALNGFTVTFLTTGTVWGAVS
jgi:hypothetical protein